MRIIAENSEWKKQLLEQREEKDRFFKNSPDSPIPSQDQEKFEGLDYYPPDPKYRFKLELHEHEEKEEVEIDTTGEGKKKYIKWGEFRLKLHGKEQTLQAYKKDPEDEGLFVPFRDDTSGGDTYGGGRYLDLDESKRTEEGEWILDFNEAYNPWCAYSETHGCPLTPPDNWLEVPVQAGERKYPLKGS